ncbi:MAG: NADH-quinone oxidoreductase subunit C [Rickettsiales bacterium]|nr:NADH-quinone oxidoreductase subunit C [Rickettsiales bacterium]
MNLVVKHIENHAAAIIKGSVAINNDMIVINVLPKNIEQILLFLRDEAKCLCVMLVSIHAVDYYEEEERFELNYNLLSLKNNLRVVVKVKVDEKTEVNSVEDIFSSAVWYQREVFDLFGVKFAKTNDLRRILTDYEFKGHPLRKDFPLTGYEEVEYDNEKKEVVYKPVKLDQEFRNFDFDSSWSAAEYVQEGLAKGKTDKN